MPVVEFSHMQYSALPSVEWQQRGRKHGRSFARLHHSTAGSIHSVKNPKEPIAESNSRPSAFSAVPFVVVYAQVFMFSRSVISADDADLLNKYR